MIKLTLEDVERKISIESLLYDLGCRKIKNHTSYISCSSPLHIDKNPSFVFYKDSLRWNDFSGDIPSGSLDYLVKLKRGMSLAEYLEIEDFGNVVLKENKIKEIPYSILINGKRNKDFNSLTPEEKIYVTRKRKINKEFWDYFQLSVSSEDTNVRLISIEEDLGNITYFGHRLLIPVKNSFGNIVSYEGRAIDENVRKVIYPASIKNVASGVSTWDLFNINYIQKHTKEPLIVCEGTMDLPVLWRIYKNVTSTYGSMLKQKHKKQLSIFRVLILMSDEDEGGYRMREEYMRNFNNLYIASLPKGKDPGECTIDELKYSLNHLKRKEKEYQLRELC